MLFLSSFREEGRFLLTERFSGWGLLNLFLMTHFLSPLSVLWMYFHFALWGFFVWFFVFVLFSCGASRSLLWEQQIYFFTFWGRMQWIRFCCRKKLFFHMFLLFLEPTLSSRSLLKFLKVPWGQESRIYSERGGRTLDWLFHLFQMLI